jgi:hypothetical protein
MTTAIVDDGATAISGQQGPSGTDKTGAPGAISSLRVLTLPRAAHLLPFDFGLQQESVAEPPPSIGWQETLVNFLGVTKEVLHVSVR